MTNLPSKEETGSFRFQDVVRLWDEYRDAVRLENRMLHAQLQGSEPFGVIGQTVLVTAPQGVWQQEKIEEPRSRRLLERILGNILHTSVQIRVISPELN